MGKSDQVWEEIVHLDMRGLEGGREGNIIRHKQAIEGFSCCAWGGGWRGREAGVCVWERPPCPGRHQRMHPREMGMTSIIISEQHPSSDGQMARPHLPRLVVRRRPRHVGREEHRHDPVHWEFEGVDSRPTGVTRRQ